MRANAVYIPGWSSDVFRSNRIRHPSGTWTLRGQSKREGYDGQGSHEYPNPPKMQRISRSETARKGNVVESGMTTFHAKEIVTRSHMAPRHAKENVIGSNIGPLQAENANGTNISQLHAKENVNGSDVAPFQDITRSYMSPNSATETENATNNMAPQTTKLEEVTKSNMAPLHATRSIIEGVLSLFRSKSPFEHQQATKSPPKVIDLTSSPHGDRSQPAVAVVKSIQATTQIQNQPHPSLASKDCNYSHPTQIKKQLRRPLVSIDPPRAQPQHQPSGTKYFSRTSIKHERDYSKMNEDDKENIPPSVYPTAASVLNNFRKELKKLEDIPPPPPHACRLFPKDFAKRLEKKAEASGDMQEDELADTQDLTNGSEEENPKPKKKVFIKRRCTREDSSSSSVMVTKEHFEWFLKLVEDPTIVNFLMKDICRRYADKYLLAMVFTYFVRAGFQQKDFTMRNFFAALYLAHDIEEDEEELKYEVFPWALGPSWRRHYPKLIQARDEIFWTVRCRAVVSRKCCDQVMDMNPDHWLWQRERPYYHGGAFRDHLKHASDNGIGHPRGPNKSPLQCQSCLERECAYSQSSYLLYLSESEQSADSSCLLEGHTFEHKERDSGYETILCGPSDTSMVSPHSAMNTTVTKEEPHTFMQSCDIEQVGRDSQYRYVSAQTGGSGVCQHNDGGLQDGNHLNACSNTQYIRSLNGNIYTCL